MEVCASPLINGAGLRGKVNQYAMIGRPFVSTSIGVCGTPYQNEKSVFMSDQPKKFAQYVVRLLQDKKAANKMSTEALRVVKRNFSWEQPIKTFLKLV